jgi:integrase
MPITPIPRIVKRGGSLMAEYYKGGRRIRRATGEADPNRAVLALADYLRADVLGEVSQGGAESGKGAGPATLGVLVSQWVESLEARRRNKDYIRKARSAVLGIIAAAGWQSLADVSPAAVEKHRESMLQGGAIATGTVNLRMAYLSAFCRWLWRTGEAKADPTVNLSPLSDQGARRRRALSESECRRLLSCKEIDPARRRAYAAMLYTGLRVSELERLRWRDIGADGLIKLVGKGRKPAAIPVGDVLADVFSDQMREGGESSLVFPVVPSPEQFAADLRTAGVEAVDARGWVAVRHSLRHTFNTLLHTAGVGTAERRALGRWSGSELPDTVYLDSAALGLKDAVNRLPRMWG